MNGRSKGRSRTKSLESLSSYIITKHHSYVKQELPRLAHLAQKVVNRHGSAKVELPIIAVTLMQLDEELTQHLAMEELILFPYIAALEQSVLTESAKLESCDLRLAQGLADSIDAEPRLERLAPIALSAVCFRYVEDGGNLDSLNRSILDWVVQRGHVYISNAMIHDRFALRACIVNHRSTEDDVRSVVSEVLSSADELR